MRTVLPILLLVVPLGLVSPIEARDIFVNNLAGDDRFTGLQRATTPDGTGPVRTIAKALRLAQQGDRVWVENTGQPYRESLTLMGSRHSGFSFQPFVLAGNGAVLDGSEPVPPNAWEHFQGPVFRFRPPRVEFQQLFLGGRPVSRAGSGGAGLEPPKLQPLQWCLHGAFLYFAVEAQKLPADYPLSYAAKPAGISLLAVENVLIRDLVVQGFHLDGVHALNRARAIRLVGVTAQHNGRSGIAVGGASRVDVEKCHVASNGYAQLLTLPWSETYLRNSELAASLAPAWADQGGTLWRDGQPVREGPDHPSGKP